MNKRFLISPKHMLLILLRRLQKRAIQKLAEVTGNIIGNKIEDKITEDVLTKQKFTAIPKDSKVEENEYQKKNSHHQKKDNK